MIRMPAPGKTPSPHAQSGPRPPALMVLGTASHVGKSLIATAFCRLFAEEGYRVAPFKAQNMALNSFVTLDGGEIGRAQVAQAEAAGVEPVVAMNPILLKPMGGVSQVVVDGVPVGVMSARDYYAVKDALWPRVTAAYDHLAARFDRIVLEGAGSPVEVNLAEHDLTNLRMARHAGAAVVLVADIERGGVFAQLVGTWELLGAADRARVAGFIINKFRGDVSLLEPGLDFLHERTGVPVLGVLPYRPDLQIDQEDSLGLDATATAGDGEPRPDELDVAVARLPGLSNFTDFWPLARRAGVRVRYVERGADLGHPDLVILPGTKTTVRDLAWLRRAGLADRLIALAAEASGPMILGLCGGFQMLGTRIDDPLGVESGEPSVAGLGLLDVTTRFTATKARHRVSGTVLASDAPLVGYEIHMGETVRGPAAEPWCRLTRLSDGETVLDGALGHGGRVIGTYVHGLFDSAPFAAGFVNQLRARRGLPPLDDASARDHREVLGARYAGLADLLRNHLDLRLIRTALEKASRWS
jgi:adenosylcobyric acid synthase